MPEPLIRSYRLPHCGLSSFCLETSNGDYRRHSSAGVQRWSAIRRANNEQCTGAKVIIKFRWIIVIRKKNWHWRCTFFNWISMIHVWKSHCKRNSRNAIIFFSISIHCHSRSLQLVRFVYPAAGESAFPRLIDDTSVRKFPRECGRSFHMAIPATAMQLKLLAPKLLDRCHQYFVLHYRSLDIYLI